MSKYLIRRWSQLATLASLVLAYFLGFEAESLILGAAMLTTIGEASADSQHTINYDALLSTTLFAFRRTMVDNIFKESAMLAFLRANGGVITQDGGERIQQPLMIGKNQTVKSYRGYETLDTTPQEGITSAFYPWAEVAGTVSISRLEERKNSGEAAILNLLQQKIEQASMSMTEKLNGDVVAGTVSSSEFVPGNGSRDLFPLGYFLRKDNTANPTSGGNVGNIAATATNASGDSYWQHKTAVINAGGIDTGNAFTLSVTTYGGMKVAVRRMYNHCARGSGGPPDLILADQVSYETFVNALQDQQRFTDTEMASLGFENVKTGRATMMWDEQVPDVENGTLAITAGTMFFVNTRFYKLVIDSQTDIVTTPFIEPENQTARTAKLLFMGNTTVSNLRKHGVMYGTPLTIAT